MKVVSERREGEMVFREMACSVCGERLTGDEIACPKCRRELDRKQYAEYARD